MGYLVQMAGLAVQNFLSAATGIVVAIALIRGFARHSAQAHRQLLGGRHPLHALLLLPLPLGPQSFPGQPGRNSELRAVSRRDHDRKANLHRSQDGCRRQPHEGRQRATPSTELVTKQAADPANGTGRFAGVDQGIGHQRWQASSTPTLRIHSRIRPRCRTCWKWLRYCSFRSR